MNPKTKRKIRKEKGDVCVYCDCNNPLYLTLDHKKAKVKGGKDDEENCQVTCWACNQLKGALNHKDFLKYLEALKILHGLAKINIKWPIQLDVKFNPHHYPEFEYLSPEEIKKKTMLEKGLIYGEKK